MLILLGIVALDPWLAPFKDAIRRRYDLTQQWIKKLDQTEGGLATFSKVSLLFAN
jgi:1,4-alpha-glucan branching enzyme